MAEIITRIPEMGSGTEIVFVEGHSKDDTYQAIEKAMEANPHRRAKLFRQTGEGKGDAVRLGFAEAEGGVLMILDADMTVPPENLVSFYEAPLFEKGGIYQRRTVGLPDGRSGHAVCEFVGQPNSSVWPSRGCWGSRSRIPYAEQRCCVSAIMK